MSDKASDISISMIFNFLLFLSLEHSALEWWVYFFVLNTLYENGGKVITPVLTTSPLIAST